MFGKRFGRHGGHRRQDDEREGRRERGHHGRGAGFPFFGIDRGEGHHFAPRHGRHGPSFGRGGPFGDDPFDGDGGGRRRQRRGDIKFILLELLAEQPRHGYDLIKELENRYGGFYRPSPGSVYPTLQLLEEEGHATSELADSKRVYTITEAGRTLLAERKERGTAVGGGGRGGPFVQGEGRKGFAELQRSLHALMASVMQAAHHGTPEQVAAATTLLDTTRREVYAILSREEKDD